MKKILLLSILILAGFGCSKINSTEVGQTQPIQYSNTTTSIEAVPETSTLTILIPENIEDYRAKMTEFAQAGGENPIKSIVFIKKEMTVPYDTDVVQKTVEEAANTVYKAGGGPAKITVDYLQIKDGVAYVQLNIDTNGWAGVSVTQAIVRPIVAKNLGQFSNITKITFGQAK